MTMNYGETALAQAQPQAPYGQFSNAAAAQPPDVSPFTSIGFSVNSVSDLCQRVRVLADRLTGSAPTPIEAGNPKQSINTQPPVFHALRMTAEQMQSEVGDAFRALDRIERMLP